MPVSGLVLLLGVDRFMAEARSVVNTIGNAVGTVAVAAWEGCLDRERLALALNGEMDVPPVELSTVAEAAPCLPGGLANAERLGRPLG